MIYVASSMDLDKLYEILGFLRGMNILSIYVYVCV